MSLLQLSSSYRSGCSFDFTPFKKKIEKYLLSDFRQADAGIPIALQPVRTKARLLSLLATSVKPERASSTYFAGQGGDGGQSEPAPTYAPVGSSVFGWAAFFHSAAISQLFFGL